MTKPPIDRLFDKTDKNGPVPQHRPELGACWVWIGAKGPRGYGTFFAGKVMSVHRFSYMHHIGPIPEGYDVMHKCDNRACINPAHLETGTRKQNMEDCVKKDRHNRGERSSRNGLKDETVILMRHLYKNGVSITELMSQFNLKIGCVSKIVYGQRWKHLL